MQKVRQKRNRAKTVKPIFGGLRGGSGSNVCQLENCSLFFVRELCVFTENPSLGLIFLNAAAVAQDQEGSGLGRRGLGVRSLVAPEPGVAPSAFIRVWMFYLEERKSE